MDDDEFGGFEAAETFDHEDGGTQTISPAIPWAAFPAVSGVHIPTKCTAESLLDQSQSSTFLLPSDAFISSGDNEQTTAQASDAFVIQSAIVEQVHATSSLPLDEVSISSSNLIEKACLENLPNIVEDAMPMDAKELAVRFEKMIASMDTKLQAAEEEKAIIKKELEDMMGKHSILAKDFLKEKDDELVSHRDRYKQLQEVHKNELEEMRKAGHEALTIIVEEFKALLQSSVQQQGEASERQYQASIEKQAHKCEELLNAQYQRLLDMLDKEKERFEQQMKEAFTQQLHEHKESLEKCLAEERQRSKDALEAAVKVEQEVMKDVIWKAVEEERLQMEKVNLKEKESWEIEHKKDQGKISQAIEDALSEERKKSQDMVKLAIAEEQKKSEMAVQEAVRQTREELMEYIKEQKRLDQVARQRSLSSLELFLSCAQKQLCSLIEDKPIPEEKN